MSILSTISLFSLRRLSASKYSSQSFHGLFDSSNSSGVHFERVCELSSSRRLSNYSSQSLHGLIDSSNSSSVKFESVCVVSYSIDFESLCVGSYSIEPRVEIIVQKPRVEIIEQGRISTSSRVCESCGDTLALSNVTVVLFNEGSMSLVIYLPSGLYSTNFTSVREYELTTALLSSGSSIGLAFRIPFIIGPAFFTSMNANFLGLGLQLRFTARNMTTFRARMTLNILDGHVDSYMMSMLINKESGTRMSL